MLLNFLPGSAAQHSLASWKQSAPSHWHVSTLQAGSHTPLLIQSSWQPQMQPQVVPDHGDGGKRDAERGDGGGGVGGEDDAPPPRCPQSSQSVPAAQ